MIGTRLPLFIDILAIRFRDQGLGNEPPRQSKTSPGRWKFRLSDGTRLRASESGTTEILRKGPRFELVEPTAFEARHLVAMAKPPRKTRKRSTGRLWGHPVGKLFDDEPKKSKKSEKR